jgi:two-component system chemotaxis response regulator CheB
MELARMTTDEAGKRDTIVLGASAGGIHALRQILCAFPSGLDAAIFIVVHLPADPFSILDALLAKVTPLETEFARDGEVILAGRIYVAPPDRHLLLYEDRIKLSHGERENRSRPAIDPLFRSAAVARRGRVIGAILSGLLNDGSAGLLSVKRCGGLAFAQAINDAREKEMPSNAAEALGGMLDGAMPAADLGRRIVTMIGSPATNAVVPLDVELEVEMLLGGGSPRGGIASTRDVP